MRTQLIKAKAVCGRAVLQPFFFTTASTFVSPLVLHVQRYCLMLSTLFAVPLLAESALPQSRVPQFKDFPVSEAYIGKNAPLILTDEDRMFRTRLREAAKAKPNFAGQYILTAWGCGSGCRTGAVIDAKTGKVFQWDFSICCWDSLADDNFKPIEFRLNSKLIVFSGARNEEEGDEGAHFYKFENGRFVHLRSILKE